MGATHSKIHIRDRGHSSPRFQNALLDLSGSVWLHRGFAHSGECVIEEEQ
jgi:hypothetical protein